MLKIFNEAGERNCNNTAIGVSRQDNQYKEVHSKKFAFKKFDYIHNNTVEAGLVEKAEEYIYSSTRDFYYSKNVGLLKIKFPNKDRASARTPRPAVGIKMNALISVWADGKKISKSLQACLNCFELWASSIKMKPFINL